MRGIGTEVIKSLQRKLSYWADASKLEDADESGVEVFYNNADGHTVMFRGVTKDDIEWKIMFDFRHISEEYIDNMFRGVKENIEQHRKKRRDESPIIIPEGAMTA